MLRTIAVLLFVLWLLGFSPHVGGGLIHALLAIALIVFVFNLLSRRRSSGLRGELKARGFRIS